MVSHVPLTYHHSPHHAYFPPPCLSPSLKVHSLSPTLPHYTHVPVHPVESEVVHHSYVPHVPLHFEPYVPYKSDYKIPPEFGADAEPVEELEATE